MSNFKTTTVLPPWSSPEKHAFRFFFLYFFFQVVPLDWKFYRQLIDIDWGQLHYGDIFLITKYAPHFSDGADNFGDWGIIFVIALAGTVVWAWLDRERREYNNLYYWLRVILRYRLAAGVIGYGFIKLFPMQAPYPSLSNLNTNYGDFTAWKIFSMTLGIVPGYESFLGFVEILAGLLLFYRKTATIGAFLVVVYTGNVFLSNLAYEGGEHIYSLSLISIAIFLLAFDAPRLYTLFGAGKQTLPNLFKPSFSEGWAKRLRPVLKWGFFGFFILFYGYKTWFGFHADPYQYPASEGLDRISGVYNVTEFRLNNRIIPYSAVDSVRWKDVVFEKWATLSIKSNRPVVLDSSNTENIAKNDKDRSYEFAGSGGRHYFSYKADRSRSLLSLENRSKHYPNEKFQLHFSRPTPNRVILSGRNEKNESLYVVLDKIDKKYLLEEAAGTGRNKAIKL
ncbi:DoxX family protein [Arcticibacter tournemirensis]